MEEGKKAHFTSGSLKWRFHFLLASSQQLLINIRVCLSSPVAGCSPLIMAIPRGAPLISSVWREVQYTTTHDSDNIVRLLERVGTNKKCQLIVHFGTSLPPITSLMELADVSWRCREAGFVIWCHHCANTHTHTHTHIGSQFLLDLSRVELTTEGEISRYLWN